MFIISDERVSLIEREREREREREDLRNITINQLSMVSALEEKSVILNLP